MGHPAASDWEGTNGVTDRNETIAAGEQDTRTSASGCYDHRDARELRLACRFTQLLADKIIFAHQLRTAPEDFDRSLSARREWAEQLQASATDYADCWRLRNKPSGLGDALEALSFVVNDMAGAQLFPR